MSLFLGIDLGTQSLKALVYDSESRVVIGRGSSPCRPPDSPRTGAAEQNPSDWWRAFGRAMREALAGEEVDSSAIVAMGVSGQQHGLVTLDDAGEVLRPAKLWCDSEASSEAAEFSEVMGRKIPPGYTAPKILWMKRKESELFRRIHRVCLPHDWLNLQLTGEWGTDPGDASGNGFFDPVAREMNSAAVDWLDSSLAAKLPPLKPAEGWHGNLIPEVALSFGLPEGLPVSVGSGDNMMSALGAGATRDGVMVASLGTSGTLFGRAPGPAPIEESGVREFLDATGSWLPLHCIENCTVPLNAVAEKSGLSHVALTELAAQREPGPGNKYMEVMEEVSFALHAGSSLLEKWGLRGEELRVVGGGSRNPLWLSLLADVFGVPVLPLKEPDTAALGAALQALAAKSGNFLKTLRNYASPTGEALQPDLERAEALRVRFERWKESQEDIA